MHNMSDEDWVPDSPLQRVPRRAAVLAQSRIAPNRRVRVKFTREFAAQVHAFVKKQRPRSLTYGEKLDILELHRHVRLQHLEHLSQNANKKKRKAPAYSAEIAKMLGRSEKTVRRTWTDFVKRKKMTTQAPTGNRNRKVTRFRRSRQTLRTVRAFVRERRETRERTVAKDVVHCLIDNDILCVDVEDTKMMQSAERSVRRYLRANGFKRGKKKGCQHYRLKEANLLARDTYVSRMVRENKRRKRRIVYMDESYIHHHYCRHDDSLYDPNDDEDLQTKARHKGSRYCFIAAIVDADHSVPEQVRTPNQKAHLMSDTLHIFKGGSRSATKNKKPTKDYHGMFDFVYFKDWMNKLLMALEQRGIQNAIIVMDNAKYHKNKPPDTPKSNTRKADMIAACLRYGLPADATETKSMLWARLQSYIKQHIQPVIVTMARARGHEVLFSPPHYSDLQPIELVWANVKGTVGRQYTTKTTFLQVKERLKQAFDAATSTMIQGCINKANRHLTELYRHIKKVEELEEDDVDDSSGSDDSSDEESSDASSEAE